MVATPSLRSFVVPHAATKARTARANPWSASRIMSPDRRAAEDDVDTTGPLLLHVPAQVPFHDDLCGVAARVDPPPVRTVTSRRHDVAVDGEVDLLRIEWRHFERDLTRRHELRRDVREYARQSGDSRRRVDPVIRG